MTSDRLRFALALAVALGFSGCSSGDELGLPDVGAPETLDVRAVSIRAVKVEWSLVPPRGQESIGYRLERRVGLTGPFEPVPGERIPAPAEAAVTFYDTDVQPDTYYGYRVRAVNTFGESSDFSVVRGDRTPPPPAILVQTVSQVNTSIADPDGYRATVAGPGDAGPTQTLALGINDARRLGPLENGSYVVALRDVAATCAVQEGSDRTAEVDDAGLATVDTVVFRVDCRDPTKGAIKVVVNVRGGGRDADDFTVRLDGINEGQTSTVATGSVAGAGGNRVFASLAPGEYVVNLLDVEQNCSIETTRQETSLAALQDVEVVFDVECIDDTPVPTEGYELRGTWETQEGGQVVYTLILDMSTFNDPAVNGTEADDIFVISGTTNFDESKLEFLGSENVTGSKLVNQGSNRVLPGQVAWQNFDTDAAKATGTQGVIKLVFQVREGMGGSVTPTTVFGDVDDVQSESGVDLRPRIIRQEQTLTIGQTGGGAPTAEANGPYTGTAGAAIAFSAQGSAAAAGRTIASYAWSFSDGTTAQGASPTKSFAAANTYIATLTVTDDQGATASDQATVTVSQGQSATPLTWRGSFGSVDPVTQLVTLTITLDVGPDIAETSGPEEVERFGIDAITWDPAVLQYRGAILPAFNTGSLQTGSPGRLSLVNGVFGTGNRTGTVAVLEVRFAPIGPRGATATTATDLGQVIGTAATGAFDYTPKIRIEEASFTIP